MFFYLQTLLYLVHHKGFVIDIFEYYYMYSNNTISKFCKKCNLTKSIGEFTKNSKSNDGFSKVCILCSQKQQKHFDEFDLTLTKTCKICNLEKKLVDFSRNSKCKFGRCNVCCSCDTKLRYNNRLKEYGLNIELYNKMLKDQDFKCLICKNTFEKLCVDHCHSTGRVRGLLCSDCNSGIGRFKENTNYLNNAIIYIKERCDV